MWGLEHPDPTTTTGDLLSPSSALSASPTVVSRLSRYSYGMALDEPFDMSRHRVEDCYRDEETGRWMAKDQMTWLLKRVWLIPIHNPTSFTNAS